MKSLSLRRVLYFTPLGLMVLLYTLLPNRYAMYDAISYAMVFQVGSIMAQGLWHPSHLLYGPLGYALFQAQQCLGLNLTPFQVYSYLGILTLLCSLLCLMKLFLLSGISFFDAVASLLVWTGSYAVWHSSTSSDLARNMLPLLFLICAFYTILRGTMYDLRSWPFVAGLFLGFSGLFHILSVFAVPALCLFVYQRIPKERFLSISCLIFLCATTLLSISYLLTAITIHGVNGIAGFIDWFSGPGGAEWFQSNLLRGSQDLFITALRGVLGTVSYTTLKEGISSAEISLLGFAIISFLILSYLSSQILYFLISSIKTISPLSKAMLTWLLVHGIFALYCDRGNIRMVLYLSVPFIIVFAESLSGVRSAISRIMTILIFLVLLFVNAATIMETESSPQSQPAFRKLASMNTASQDPGDLFLVSMGTDASYAQYFGQKRALKIRFEELCSEVFFDLMEATWKQGYNVFLDKEVVHRTNPETSLKDICHSNIKVFNSVPGKPVSQWLQLRKDMTGEDRPREDTGRCY